MVPLCEQLRINQTPKHANFVIGSSGCHKPFLLSSGVLTSHVFQLLYTPIFHSGGWGPR